MKVKILYLVYVHLPSSNFVYTEKQGGNTLLSADIGKKVVVY